MNSVFKYFKKQLHQSNYNFENRRRFFKNTMVGPKINGTSKKDLEINEQTFSIELVENHILKKLGGFVISFSGFLLAVSFFAFFTLDHNSYGILEFTSFWIFISAILCFFVGVQLKILNKFLPAKLLLQPDRLIISRGAVIFETKYKEIDRITNNDIVSPYLKKIIFNIKSINNEEIEIRTSYEIYDSLIDLFPEKIY